MTLNFESLLELSNIEKLDVFIHKSIDNLIGQEKVSNSELNENDFTEISWSSEEHEKLQKQLQYFYRQCILSDSLSLPDDVPNIIKSTIENIYYIRRKDIFKEIAVESLMQAGARVVNNFDWKLKWVMGSSKLATIREPLLQIDLHFTEINKKCSTLNFEANLELVNNLIEELTRVKIELKEA